MGLFSGFFARPSPRGRGADVADDGLAAGMYVDVFHYNLLLTFAAVSVEGFEQCRVSAGALVCLNEIFARVSGCLRPWEQSERNLEKWPNPRSRASIAVGFCAGAAVICSNIAAAVPMSALDLRDVLMAPRSRPGSRR